MLYILIVCSGGTRPWDACLHRALAGHVRRFWLLRVGNEAQLLQRTPQPVQTAAHDALFGRCRSHCLTLLSFYAPRGLRWLRRSLRC